MATLVKHVRASKDQLFALLADYRSYVDWTPDVVEATVLAAEGDIMVVELYSPELLEERYQLECIHSKPVSIAYRQIGQPYDDRGLIGSWHLADAADRKGTTVTGEMSLNAGFFKSFSNRKKAGLILQRRLEVLQWIFSPSTTAENSGLGVADHIDRGDGISRLSRDEQETVVWFGGTKYLARKVR